MNNFATAPRCTQTLHYFTYGDDVTGRVSDYGKRYITIEVKPGKHYTVKLDPAEKGLIDLNKVLTGDVIRLRNSREGIEYVLKLDVIERGEDNPFFRRKHG